MYIKLNRIQYPVFNLGPGKRVAIWTQGCSIRCNNCVSKSLWTSNKGKNVKIKSLAQFIANRFADYDGITVTGGEPFDQYEGLQELCKQIKNTSNLNIFIFTGFTLDQLRKIKTKHEIFNYIDFLLDGPYIESENTDLNWKGSKNQILYMKEGNELIPVKDPKCNSNIWSLSIIDRDIFLSGIPRKKDLNKISSFLQLKGINSNFRSRK